MGWWDDRWHDLEDGAASLVGMKKPSEVRAEQHAADDARRRDTQRRRQLDDQEKKFRQDLDGGFDPPSISQRTNWDSWDHTRIHTMVQQIQPGELTGHGQDWAKLGSDLRSATDNFHTAVTKAISGNWTGQAAASAVSAPQSITSWGKDFGTAVQTTGTQIQTAGVTADQAKATVPEPVNFNWRRSILGGLSTSYLGGVGAGVDAYAQHQEQQNTKAAAVRVMNSVYTPGYVDADKGTPTFTTPTDPTQPPPTQPPPPGQPPMNPPQPPTGPPFQPHHSDTPGHPGSPGHTGGGQHVMPHPAPPASPLPTDPSHAGGGSVVPSASGGPYPGPAAGFGPGGGPANSGSGFGPGGVAFGPGAGGLGSGGSRGGGAGSQPSGPGTRSGATAMPAEEGVTSAGAGRPGAGGAGGPGAAGGPMGAGARGGRGEADKERRSAAYLVDEQHGNVIVGDLPLTAPPVIGEG
jgi:hypothetical protein